MIKKVGRGNTTSTLDPMSAYVGSQSHVSDAYDCAVLPISDRLLTLVETPLGAMSLLMGLTRHREGTPLNLLVRPGVPIQRQTKR